MGQRLTSLRDKGRYLRGALFIYEAGRWVWDSSPERLEAEDRGVLAAPPAHTGYQQTSAHFVD